MGIGTPTELKVYMGIGTPTELNAKGQGFPTLTIRHVSNIDA